MPPHPAKDVQQPATGHAPAARPTHPKPLPTQKPAAHSTSSAAADSTAKAKQWEIWGVTMKRDEVIVTLALALLGTFLASLLFPAIWRGIKKLYAHVGSWWRPATALVSFHEKEPAEAAKHFVAHELQRWDATRREWLNEAAAQSNSIRYCIDEVFTSLPKFYLLLGPTGIGKTTFLLSLYAQYAQETRHKHATRLLLGRVSDFQALEETLQARIADKTSANTILLLDALDEYQYAHTLNASFDEEFEQFWATFRRDKAPKFKKVIVAVREQFFQNQMQEDLLGDGKAGRLRLQPFDQARQEKWLGTYYQEKPAAFQSGLRTLNLAILERGHDFMRLPLLLTFLESLFEEQERQTKAKKYQATEFFVDHHMMRLLVGKWLDRELTAKGLNPESLSRFCQLLAAEISRAPQATSLSVKELQHLEKQEFFDAESVIAAFGGRNDRSLLKRTVTKEGFRFEFVHERFLGYFLALYAEESPENAARIPFEKHPYALRYLVGKRWRERLQAPLPAYQKPATGDNVVPLPVLRAWGEVLDGLVADCNAATRAVFQESWEEILGKEVPDWRKHFQGLENLTIASMNLAQRKDESAQVGIRYLRNFVTKVDLFAKKLASNELSFLINAQNINWLDLRDTYLPAVQLATFALSAQHLKNLWLKGIDLRNNSPAWFAQTERLTELGLTDTHLPATRLADFAPRAQHLTSLWLKGIDLRSDCPAWFARTERLTELDLRDTHLPAAQLTIFAPCAQNLTSLWLNGIDLRNDCPAWFAQTERLIELNLQDTHLPATRLADLVLNAQHFRALGLSGIDLHNYYPAWFTQTERLTELGLNNTRLPSHTLALFKASAPSLLFLDVSENPDITEASFACFGEHQERLMTLAEANGWSRTGPNLPSSASEAANTDSSPLFPIV